MSRSITSTSTSIARPVRAARGGPSAVMLAGILWGTAGVLVQLIRRSTDLSPVGISFYRLAIAAVALLLFLAPQWRAQLLVLRPRAWSMVLIGVGLGAYQALYFLAVAWGGVALATVLSLGLAPVLIAGWEAARSRRRPTRAALCSITAALVGLALITGCAAAPTVAAPRPLLGLLAASGSGVGYAATTVLSRSISREVAPLTMTATAAAVGALTLLPFAWWNDDFDFPVLSAATGMLAYLGIVSTAVAHALFYAGLRTTKGSVAVVLTLLEAVTAAVLAAVVLGEQMSLSLVAGGTLLLGAVVLASVSGPDLE